MKRPIVIITVGYIIGILMGLYCNISIALLYFIMFIIYLTMKILSIKLIKYKKGNEKNKFKLFSVKRYIRYVRLLVNKNVIILFLISSIISNLIILNLNKKYDVLYSDIKDANIIGIVCSNKKEKEYKNVYKLKVESINSNNKYKNTYLLLNTDKDTNLEYGNKVKVKGEFIKPATKRNYKGFDYKLYLKTIKVYGTISSEKIEVIDNDNLNFILIKSNNLFLRIKNNIENMYNKNQASIILGIMLGYTDEIDENTKEEFSNSSISHILAVSGMHISYIIICVLFIFTQIIGKGKAKIIAILILIIYILITGFSASILRAGIMGILVLLSQIIYRKNDIWTSISISLFIILIYNPYLILNPGLSLSYTGTLGIILFQKNIFNILQNIKIKQKDKRLEFKLPNKRLLKIKEKVNEILSVIFSAQIVIMPISILYFNKISTLFLITNILVSLVIGIIVILGFIQIFLSLISVALAKFISFLIFPFIEFLNFITNFINKIPINKIYIKTPDVNVIIMYYIVLFILFNIIKIYSLKSLNYTELRVKNIISLLKYKFKLNRKNIEYLACGFIIVIFILNSIPKDLKVHFIDVGQGDSTLIITPKNKTILIDGGGSTSKEYDVGKSTLLPYLLDRKVTKIDYMIISHFDQDHIGGLFAIMEELKVKQVIISKQKESCENLQKFLQIVKEKDINVKIVKAGDRIYVEKNLFMDILWPTDNLEISDNPLNNNAIITKLVYKNFSMLFTGDIEKIAEEDILKLYKDTKILKSTVLKVAHHGSKTSSTKEFLEAVKPKISLIGVGKNNKFGHPSNITLENLKDIDCTIFRTDEDGEIIIRVNIKGKIWIDKMLN